jgi:hypothetical protein
MGTSDPRPRGRNYGYIVRLLLDAIGELNCFEAPVYPSRAPVFRSGFSIFLGPFAAVWSVSFGFPSAETDPPTRASAVVDGDVAV